MDVCVGVLTVPRNCVSPLCSCDNPARYAFNLVWGAESSPNRWWLGVFQNYVLMTNQDDNFAAGVAHSVHNMTRSRHAFV